MSISMYFAVSWLEPRLQINESATEWTEDRTGPLNVQIILATLSLLKLVLAASEWVSRKPEIYLVPWAGNIWTGYIWAPESVEGDVWSEDHQEQNHHLWTGVRIRTSLTNNKYLPLPMFSVRIAISCQMNFDDYPLDAHTCQFQVGSCKYKFCKYYYLFIMNCKYYFINFSTFYRLWHQRNCDLSILLYIWTGETKKSSTFHTDWETSNSFQESYSSIR